MVQRGVATISGQGLPLSPAERIRGLAGDEMAKSGPEAVAGFSWIAAEGLPGWRVAGLPEGWKRGGGLQGYSESGVS